MIVNIDEICWRLIFLHLTELFPNDINCTLMDNNTRTPKTCLSCSTFLTSQDSQDLVTHTENIMYNFVKCLTPHKIIMSTKKIFVIK